MASTEDQAAAAGSREPWTTDPKLLRAGARPIPTAMGNNRAAHRPWCVDCKTKHEPADLDSNDRCARCARAVITRAAAAERRAAEAPPAPVATPPAPARNTPKPTRPKGPSMDTRPPAATPPTPDQPDPGDDIRTLVTSARQHQSKQIRSAADRVMIHVDKLIALIVADRVQNAEARRIQQEQAAARAEVDRLKEQLAAAQAKLRPAKTPKPTGGRSVRVEGGDFPCRNDGCDKHYDSPQGRSLHERLKCEHRDQATAS